MRFRPVSLAVILVTASAYVGLSCGGGNSGGVGASKSAGTATVNVTLSDPATCAAPQGPYSHVYLTIAGVRGNPSATALPSDAGWVDLAPNLASNPVQIDMVGNAALQCSLPALASSTQITPTTFQQLRVTLLDNGLSSKVANNNCGTAANCVVVASNNAVQTIGLTSESQSGISIPATQIAAGSFKVDANQTKTLNLSVNACASVVVQSSGQLRLKPVMFAGEVGSNSTSISGKVVDGVLQGAIAGGKVVVALEQKDGSGTDRVIQATVPDGTGAFSFCSLPSGNYDVVAIATNGLNIAYGATIATGVPPGTNLGNIPVFPQPGPNQAPATITGQITTVGAAGGVSVDVSASVLQSISVTGNSLPFTVPQLTGLAPTLSLATAANVSCPANTNCVNYSLTVPATNPTVGVFATTGTTYSQVTGSAPYVVDAIAFVPGSGNTPDCSPSEVKTAGLSVNGGATVNAPVLGFVGCR